MFLSAVPGLNEIQDAYVIAVEEQARQRLEQLSVLHKVRPVDISKVDTFGKNIATVGLEGNQNGTRSPAFSTDNPTYVAEAVQPGIEESTVVNEQHTQQAQSSSGWPGSGSVDSVAGTSGASGSEESLSIGPGEDSMESGVTNGYMNGHTNTAMIQGGVEQPRYPINGALRDANTNRMSGGQGQKAPTIPQYFQYDQHDRQRSKENMYDTVDSDSDHAEGRPHREMAIDCPPSFVGKAKEPPRLPSQNPNRPSPRSSTHSTPVKRPPEYGSSETRNWAENITPYTEAPRPTREEQLANEEKIRKYQEDLRKREEDRNRLAQEEEFLRTSLRGSKKLQALEEARTAAASRASATGIINPIFTSEEEVDSADGSRSQTLPLAGRDSSQVPKKPASGK